MHRDVLFHHDNWYNQDDNWYNQDDDWYNQDDDWYNQDDDINSIIQQKLYKK